MVSGGETLTCNVFIEDESGSIVTDSNESTIGNTGPTVRFSRHHTRFGKQLDTITCAGTSSDIDGDALAETYTWTNASTGVALGSGNTLSLTPLSVTFRDSILCAYEVGDASQTDSGTAVLIVGNTSPIITSITLAALRRPISIQTLTCTATIEEPDLETTTVGKIWTNDTTGQANWRRRHFVPGRCRYWLNRHSLVRSHRTGRIYGHHHGSNEHDYCQSSTISRQHWSV